MLLLLVSVFRTPFKYLREFLVGVLVGYKEYKPILRVLWLTLIGLCAPRKSDAETLESEQKDPL